MDKQISLNKGKSMEINWIQYSWGLLIPIVGGLTKAYLNLRERLSKHDTDISLIEQSCTHLEDLANDSKAAHTAILTSLDSIRKDQREDYHELQKSIHDAHRWNVTNNGDTT